MSSSIFSHPIWVIGHLLCQLVSAYVLASLALVFRELGIRPNFWLVEVVLGSLTWLSEGVPRGCLGDA